ncbi:MAG: hypothetical protein Q8O91_10465, partial [Candidatus Aminicenantes bacterium]|nr:hypothetical protein [Candidatus Aminicenantes bacterium]
MNKTSKFSTAGFEPYEREIRRAVSDMELGAVIPRIWKKDPTVWKDKDVKGRAFAAEVDPRAMPGALTRDVNTRLSTAETDPQTKPGAPAAAPAA